MSPDISSKNIDHLGIVAGVCEQIGLVEQIDALVPDTGRTVSVGQAVKAMVLNGLGFVGKPLYLTPHFYQTKPVDLLIGEGIRADDLNSDSLGKALDYVHEAGVTEAFAKVSAYALKTIGMEIQFAHLDTTAFSLQGAYEMEEEDGEVIDITYGYSKDHRPDLKQAIMGLICANTTSIPLYLNTLSGNTSDKTSMPEMAQAYLDQFAANETMPVLVADSALYSSDAIKKVSQVRWVTRVPATITEAKDLLAATTKEQMIASQRENYFYYEGTSSYGDVKQRWVVILNEARRAQEFITLDKQVTREADTLAKKLKKLKRKAFKCAADAENALETFAAKWRFHTVTGTLIDRQRYARPGRPTPDSPKVTEWFIDAQWQPDDDRIAARAQPLGKYIIATNDLDAQRLSAEDLLTVYKDQNTSVERGFRFLKDPAFFAHSLFLKKPSRISGLLMVMGLSLLVYALAEQQLRDQLAATDQTVPNQKRKPTQRPTMRWVFQLFEGIHLVSILSGPHPQRLVTNVSDLHIQIASLFGPEVLKFYQFEETPL